jgi:regulator of sigma E protease
MGSDAMSVLAQVPFAVIGFSAVAYIAALIVIVFVHEFGHFQVGRWCGVKIEAFAIGFGRELFGFNDRYGTRWKVCLLPLGGYVKFAGDANAASLPSADAALIPGSLQAATVWRRMAIVVAGPVANFLLAIFIFAAAFMFVGTPVNEPRIDSVTEDGAAKAAGLQSGDFIRAIDGKAIHSFGDIQDIMMLQEAQPLQLQVERAGQTLEITLVPKIVELPDGFGSTRRQSLIGIVHEAAKDPKRVERLGPIDAVAKGAERTWFVAQTTLRYIGKVFLGSERSNQLHGPLGVAKFAGETASMGIWPFVFFIGLISVSIGLVNLFPVPMLDGGHLAFYLIEAVLGKPVSPQAQEWSFRIGLSAILMLMIFATTNDISRYATMIFGG